MPTTVLVVHREPDARQMLLAAIRAAGHETEGFGDPLKVLDAIDAESRVRVLVTQIDFGPGKLNGIALARMLRIKKAVIRIVFVGRPQNEAYIDELGEFVPHPVDVPTVVDTVGRLLAAKD